MSLYLHTFSSRYFRNLVEEPCHFHPRFNVIFGENGQGKTNLLEAIYYLMTLRPLRSVRSRELLQWGQDHSIVQGVVHSRTIRKMAVHFSKNKRQIDLNGAPPLTIEDYFDGTQVVSFTPEEIQLVRGAPELRRRFIDRAIFNTDVSYLHDVKKFLRILAQRNAHLKQQSPDLAMLDVFNEQYAKASARVIVRRLLMIEQLRHHLYTAFFRIFPERTVDIAVQYQCSIREDIDVSQDRIQLEQHIEQACLSELQRVKQREIERRKSLFGPHLDDISFLFEGRPFKVSASQGQTRALVLALKIAEIHEIETRTGSSPLLLLDDVAGELDPKHSAFFFQFLEETNGQIILTTTDLNYIPLPDLGAFHSFSARKGSFHPQNDLSHS